MNCEKALLKEPPLDLATQKLGFFVAPPRADGKDKDTYKEEQKPFQNQRFQPKREAFMLCHMTTLVNEAIVYLKQHACGENANFSRIYTVHDDPSNY